MVEVHPDNFKNLHINREINNENTMNIYNIEFELFENIIEYNNDEGSRFFIEFPTVHGENGSNLFDLDLGYTSS